MELAEKLPALGLTARDPIIGIRDSEEDNHRAELKAFAAGAQPGQASEPIAIGKSYWILKAIRRRSGRNDTFDQPGVQAEILNRLVNRKQEELQNRLVRKNVRIFKLNWTPPPFTARREPPKKSQQ